MKIIVSFFVIGIKNNETFRGGHKMFGTAFTKYQRFTLIILALILCLPLAACTKEPPAPSIHTTSVIRSSELSMFEYGNFIYFSRGEIFRYNTLTGELTSACFDPECDGKCPLHGGITRIGMIEDGKMYFYSFAAFTHDINLGYQDLISGTVTVLETLNQYEMTNDLTFVSNGYFYYYAGVLKDGGDPKKYEDYDTRLCRIPLTGGEREILETPNGIPTLIVDGKLVMIGRAVTVYDIETKLEKVVWNFSEDGFKQVSDISYVDGKLYMIAKASAEDAERVYNEYKGVEYTKNLFLVSVNISTGEWQKVTEEAVEAYTLTDDRVYYFPTEIRNLYIPEDYEKNREDIHVTTFGATLYSRKPDGSDPRAEYTRENLYTCYDYTVIGGKLYGFISLCDEVNHVKTNSDFSAIDLSTGEIIGTYDVRRK